MIDCSHNRYLIRRISRLLGVPQDRYYEEKPRRLSKHTLWIFLIFMLGGCYSSRSYTSLDLSGLPCEISPYNFLAVEFNKDGLPLYPDQFKLIENRVQEHDIKSFYVFIHGWNKTVQVAESEYQDFVCRFLQKRPPNDRFLLIGVFWPSTLIEGYKDHDLIKPFSFNIIRNRAEILAAEGMPKLFDILKRSIVQQHKKRMRHVRLSIIGHSFGGLVALRSFSDLVKHSDPEYYASILHLDLVLLLAAASQEDVEDLLNMEKRSTRRTSSGEFPKIEISPTFPYEENWNPMAGFGLVRVFNVFSKKDWANRFLYPVGRLFTTGCAVGACEIEELRIFTVNNYGLLSNAITVDTCDQTSLNFAQYPIYSGRWNVDASCVISNHTDIFKGRLVNLLWNILNSTHWREP